MTDSRSPKRPSGNDSPAKGSAEKDTSATGSAIQESPIVDPNAAAEAAKYDNPVPSREALLMLLEQAPGPMSHEDVCLALGETDPGRVEALRRRLIAMSRDGQAMSNRRNQFFPMDKAGLVMGKVMGHRDGFGFVLRDGDDDVFLSNRQMRKVFHGDKVAVQVLGHDRRGRPEGKIVQVLERNTRQVVGRFYDQGGVGSDADNHSGHYAGDKPGVHAKSGFGIVQPDNKRVSHEILIPEEARNGAKHGQFVVVTISTQPNPGKLPMGQVIEVLGDHLAPGMEIEVAIRSHNIPSEWPLEVGVEAKKLPDEVNDADKPRRIDLRHLPFVTIDGEDARDFDDAVYCEKNKNTGGWRLYVAIADVSHYVDVQSALDKEAHQRGNSVYFPGFVVPMLPEKLSNGLCSLNPQVDRLVMVCEMTISKAGKVSGYRFMEGVIHSHARLTYNKVWSMLEQPITEEGATWREHYAELMPHIDGLYQLFKLLREKREERGAMDFDSVETRIEFDANRKIQQIVPTERNDAHMLIEECMLAANVCSANFLKKYKVPALYRVHAGPSAEKVENLSAFLGEIGLSMNAADTSLGDARKPTPKHYQDLLARIQDRPDAHLIQTVLLRSLSQAVYHPENEGHFGLAYPAYTHFTSPIRRYPDLLVHRAIRSVIRSEQECRNATRAEGAEPIPKDRIYPYDLQAILALGEHCSMTERRADDATRDVTDFLKCEYIQDRVGDVFEGVISAVTGFGLFVELKDVYVEGLVHVSSLQNDFYQFDSVKHRLIGERTRRSFRLGDSLWVQVTGVDLDERKVDFELATAPMNRGRGGDTSTDSNTAAPAPAGRPRRKDRKKTTGTNGESAESKRPSGQQPARKTATGALDGEQKKRSKRKKLKSGSKPKKPSRAGSTKTATHAGPKKPAAKRRANKS